MFRACFALGPRSFLCAVIAYSTTLEARTIEQIRDELAVFMLISDSRDQCLVLPPQVRRDWQDRSCDYSSKHRFRQSERDAQSHAEIGVEGQSLAKLTAPLGAKSIGKPRQALQANI